MPLKLDYSFHSHTFRCGHASGDIEDYVKKAIEHGFKYYGVSDHVFLPGISQPIVRGEFSCLEDYIETYYKVKDKYKDQIHMFLAFECEYSPVFVDYYKYLLNERKFDYLICGQHMAIEDDKTHWWCLDKGEAGLTRYRDDVIAAMKSGLFLYLAHPDLFFLRVKEITPFIQQITDEIIEIALEYDVPLELNIQGLYRKEKEAKYGNICYPAEYFWERAGEKGAKVVIGGDYHDPERIGDEDKINQIKNFVMKYNLNLLSPEKLIERIKRK